MDMCLRSLGGKGAADYGALAGGDDLGAGVLDVRVEIEPQEGGVAVGTIRRAVGAGGPLVILKSGQQGGLRYHTAACTSRSFFIMDVWQSSQLTV